LKKRRVSKLKASILRRKLSKGNISYMACRSLKIPLSTPLSSTYPAAPYKLHARGEEGGKRDPDM